VIASTTAAHKLERVLGGGDNDNAWRGLDGDAANVTSQEHVVLGGPYPIAG